MKNYLRSVFLSIGNVHLLSWIMLIVLDLLWNIPEITATISIVGIPTLLLSSIVIFILCFVLVFLIQKVISGDSMGEAAVKGVVMAVIAAVPFSIVSFIARGVYSAIRGLMGLDKAEVAKDLGIKDWNLFATTASLNTPEYINLLLERIDNGYSRKDYSQVLGTAAMVFETIAKETFGDNDHHNNSPDLLRRYGKKLHLDRTLIYEMINVYRLRSITPFASHGAARLPNLVPEQAEKWIDLVKTMVTIHYGQRVTSGSTAKVRV
jgi:hypothetical protein